MASSLYFGSAFGGGGGGGTVPTGWTWTPTALTGPSGSSVNIDHAVFDDVTSGIYIVGTAPSDFTASASFNKTFTDPTLDVYSFRNVVTFSPTNDALAVYGASVELDSSTTHDAGIYDGLFIGVSYHGSGDLDQVAGIDNEVNVFGTGDVGTIYGEYSSTLGRGSSVSDAIIGKYIVAQAIETSTTSYVAALEVWANREVGATADAAYAISIDQGSAPDVNLPVWYGLYISDQTGQAQAIWPIYFDRPGHVFSVDNDGIASAAGLKVAMQTPASAAAAGVKDTIAFDTGFIYICTATNTWKRVAIATW